MKKHLAFFTMLFVGCLLILSGALHAAQLNTADIVKLKQLGFSDQEIQQEVHQSGEMVALGKEGITELKKAGLSEGLIAALAGEDPQAQGQAEAVETPPGATPVPAAESKPVEKLVAPIPAPEPQVLQPGAPDTGQPEVSAPAKEEQAAKTEQLPVPAPDKEAVAPAEPASTAAATPAPPAVAEEDESPRPRKRRRLFGASEKHYSDEAAPAPSEEEEFVQPQIPAAPPAPAPVPAPAPKLQSPAAPVPTQPAAMVAQTTAHRMQAGEMAAFNLPYNNSGPASVMVTAMAPGADWITIAPTGASAAAGGSAEFRVQLSAAALAPGNYQGSVFLSAEGSSIEYPFQLTVLPGARPLSQPIRPMPVPTPAPVPRPFDQPIPPPGRYGSPMFEDYRQIEPAPPSGYGALSPELVGSWFAVLPGEWGMQTILYIELEANGRYTYSELQGNQLVDQSTGSVTARGNLLQVVTDDGESEAYVYQLYGDQLYINMPELGGNVPFYRE